MDNIADVQAFEESRILIFGARRSETDLQGVRADAGGPSDFKREMARRRRAGPALRGISAQSEGYIRGPDWNARRVARGQRNLPRHSRLESAGKRSGDSAGYRFKYIPTADGL